MYVSRMKYLCTLIKELLHVELSEILNILNFIAVFPNYLQYLISSARVTTPTIKLSSGHEMPLVGFGCVAFHTLFGYPTD